MWKRIRSFYPVGANQPEAIRDNRNPTPTKKAPEGATGTTPQEAAKSIIRHNQYLGIRLNTLDYGSNCHIVNKRPDWQRQSFLMIKSLPRKTPGSM